MNPLTLVRRLGIRTLRDAGLPRQLLSAPFDAPKADREGFRNLRVALVKQEVYTDLYACHTGLPAWDTVRSSLMRSGPAALFTACQTQFHIVRLVDDPECQLWRQTCSDCWGVGPDFMLKVRDEPYKGHPVPQKDYAVDVESIAWDAYDIVIGINAPIPARVTRRFPNTLWANMVSEPCMREYALARYRPTPGYDVFLNQRFRHVAKPATRPHEIDFPYYLQYSGVFHELAGLDPDAPRSGVMLEHHSMEVATDADLKRLEQFGPVRSTGKSVEETVRNLAASKYFLRFGGRRLWGNAMIEAAAAGCMALGEPAAFKNLALFNEAAALEPDSFLERLGALESDQGWFDRALADQRARLDAFCFDRPLSALVSALERKRSTPTVPG